MEENGFLVQHYYCYFSKRYFLELLLMDNIWVNLKGKNPSDLLIYICPLIPTVNFVVVYVYF